ncbi:FHA domain-containing protein [Rubinisphaera sp.]|uniref:FHA domain-containing protein n=1 Tax=Rubinisphaera sp. TaxID=2024857 RepID=UPI0025ECBD69|nr:FHA domain-containing protein [Rubinisphaera sp.]|tara:strand:- start:6379 stop:9879 length:3501 start_codon:yes stop_codon:yes gene_type:complete
MPMQDDMKTKDKQSVVNNLTYLLEPVRNKAVNLIELTAGEYRIGTSKSCEICLDVAGVALEHCRIVCAQGIISLQSDDNRTWLNDGPVKKARLNVGDHLTIGPISFLFRTRTDQVPTTDSVENEDDLSVQLAQKLPEAIQAGRIDRTAERLIEPILNSTNEKSIVRAMDELHQSLHYSQKKFESQRAALSYRPNPYPELPRTAFLEKQNQLPHPEETKENSNQSPNLQPRIEDLNEREQTIKTRKDQIIRLTKKMSQRRIADEAALEKSRQELEARHLELNTRAQELDHREQAIHEHQTFEQREDQEQILELKSTIKNLQSKIDHLEKTRQSELETHAIQKAKQEAEQSRLAEYEKHIQIADERLDDQAQEIGQAQAKIQSQAELIDRQLKEIVSLQLDNNRLLELETTANQNNEKFEHQIAKQLEELNEIQALVEELQSQQNIAEQTASELQRIQEELRETQQQLAEESQSHQVAREQLQSCLESLSSMESLSQHMTEELTESLKQQEELLSLNIELQTSAEESQSKLTEISDELEQKQEDLEQATLRNDEYAQSIEKLEQQRDSLQAECDLARQKADSLEEQLQEMTTQYEQQAEAAEASQEEVDALKAMIAEFEKSRENDQSETEELLAECENLREQFNSLHAEHLGVQDEVEDLQARLKSNQSSSELNQELEAELQALRSDIAELEQTSSKQQDLLESTSEDLEHFRNKQDQYDSMRAELDQEWDKLSQERDRLLELRQDLENERDAFQQSRYDLDQLRQEVADQQLELLNSKSQESVAKEPHLIEEEPLTENFKQSAEEIISEEVEEIHNELNEEEAITPDELPHEESEPEELELDDIIQNKDDEEDAQPSAQEIDYAESVENALAVTPTPHVESLDDSSDVRKRIAEMFGLIDDAVAGTTPENDITEANEEDDLSEDDLSEDEVTDEFQLEEDSQEEREAEETEDLAANSDSQQNENVVVDDIEDADSVAAYMERLFARTNGKQTYESPKTIDKPAVKPAPAPKSIENESEIPSIEEATINIYPDNIVTPQKSKAPIAKVDRDAVMREIASLRDVANQTARSALITHKWKHLRLKVYLNSTLTGIAALGTVVLLAGPLWHGDQFLMYAAAMGTLTMVSAYSLLQNYVTFKRMKAPAERQMDTEEVFEQQETDLPSEELEI